VFSGQVYDLKIEKEEESWESIWARAIGKVYDPNVFYKFAIFLPSVSGWAFPNPIPYNSADTRKRTVAEIVRACETKHMPYVVLYKGQCTWEDFNSVLSSPSIRYAYMVTHGGTINYGSSQNPIYITRFRLTGSKVVSHESSYIKKSSNIHYMHSLGLSETERMRIVHIDACSQTVDKDMADEWIDRASDEDPSTSQLFISWQGEVILTNNDWDEWGSELWRRLGDGENYETAKENALIGNDSSYLILHNIKEIGWKQVTFISEGH
jgi:hypothetical protein